MLPGCSYQVALVDQFLRSLYLGDGWVALASIDAIDRVVDAR